MFSKPIQLRKYELYSDSLSIKQIKDDIVGVPIIFQDYYYDVDAYDQLHSFIADCDRKTEQSKVTNISKILYFFY